MFISSRSVGKVKPLRHACIFIILAVKKAHAVQEDVASACITTAAARCKTLSLLSYSIGAEEKCRTCLPHVCLFLTSTLCNWEIWEVIVLQRSSEFKSLIMRDAVCMLIQTISELVFAVICFPCFINSGSIVQFYYSDLLTAMSDFKRKPNH